MIIEEDLSHRAMVSGSCCFFFLFRRLRFFEAKRQEVDKLSPRTHSTIFHAILDSCMDAVGSLSAAVLSSLQESFRSLLEQERAPK